jgi:2-aminoethylphosphonate-pyruvate transaminase
MITTAVILAAGLGSRLGPFTAGRPKGFIAIDDVPIVERSIHKLIACGIERIIIGTGFCSEAYEALISRYPYIVCVKNTEYAGSGSMRTLHFASSQIDDDFLLLESDLVYETAALRVLLNSDFRDCILASDPSGSGDEVFIETNGANLLVGLSKNPALLRRVDGELVGISRVSRKTLEALCTHANALFSSVPKLDYEHAFVDLAGCPRFGVEKVARLAWCEIDDLDHYERAVNEIYPRVRDSERMWHVKRNVLLNPGPSTTSDSVKYAQVVPDICPRETAFGNVLSWICRELAELAGPSGACVTTLFSGSGTAAVESMVSSVVGDGVLLIIDNGAYGRRMVEIATTYGIQHHVFPSDPFRVIDLSKLEIVIDQISRSDRITHLAVVHHETTTGLLNDIGAVGKLCKRKGIEMIVDAVSSFAAVPIDMKAMNIGHMASTANKNLQGMAGVSFVVSLRTAMERLKTVRARSYYLDLYQQCQSLTCKQQARFTPPVQTLYALRQAILETKAETVAGRYSRYAQAWELLVDGLDRLGLRYPVPRSMQSRLVTTIEDPSDSGYRFEEMHDFLLERGFTIYPGKVGATSTFRIATMGAITARDIERFVELLGRYLDGLKA